MHKKHEILCDVSLILFGSLYFGENFSEAKVLEKTTYKVHVSTCFFYFVLEFFSCEATPK
jgi:hypothetical protein